MEYCFEQHCLFCKWYENKLLYLHKNNTTGKIQKEILIKREVNLKVTGEKQKTHWRLRTNKFPVGLMQEFYITHMQ